MKFMWILLLAFQFPSCHNLPPEPQPLSSHIIAFVHWQEQPLAGKRIQLVETGETTFTGSNGKAEFTVAAGKYVVRAFDINRGGPCCAIVDFDVEVKLGETITVDIVDCLPCLEAIAR